ncbi:MAG: hypothetical protein HS117_14050 [Verrucomicrobiaceae bacterium]|jgi:hypothetical protein|nr:hypothetical protein [Verrucomicrobiaceae bacterium]
MKSSLLILLASAATALANPEIASIVSQEFGAATSDGILLIQSGASPGEPEQWYVYARDPFRQGEVVRADISQQGRSWTAKPNGAGARLLRATPPAPIAFSRVKLRSYDVRAIASRAAVESKTTFSSIEYQLAVNSPNGAPEWGLALLDGAGVEVGFLLISAETGVINHQQWANQALPPSGGVFGNKPQAGDRGSRAAQDVKDAARRAWNWTEGARKETKSFFKELFSRD